MKGFVKNIEDSVKNNVYFRHVLFTSHHCQLVVMSIDVKDEIGAETHRFIDQFFKIEEGEGQVVIEGCTIKIKAGYGMCIPAGTRHNIINTGNIPLKLYTIYSPPNHMDETIHVTHSDAIRDTKDKFDGKLTE